MTLHHVLQERKSEALSAIGSKSGTCYGTASLTTEDMDIPSVTTSVRSLYGSKTFNIIEARYKAFMYMSDDKEND